MSILTQMIKGRGGLANAIPASLATVPNEAPSPIAEIATIALADPETPNEQDFKFAYLEAVDRIQAIIPQGTKTIELANHAEIQLREEAVDGVWLEARAGRRHGELFGQFRTTVAEWEAALLNGLITVKKQ